MPCGRNSPSARTSFAIAVLALVMSWSCGQAPPPPAASTAAPSAAGASASGEGSVPHGDHNPHHGGVVMMKGELHYEVVVDPSGQAHRLYFTDAIREDLPAT